MTAAPPPGPSPQLFASVGSMFAFDRFVQAVDDWAAANPTTPVLIQIGDGAYQPRHARFVRMVSSQVYKNHIRDARLFVAHAGMGSIISALEAQKALLMMPRRLDLGEHTTDHQFATIDKFAHLEGMHTAFDVAELHAKITALLAGDNALSRSIAPFAGDVIVAKVRAFITGATAG